MIISHKHRFVFIANGKTGTTSIESILEPFNEESHLAVDFPGLFNGKHMPASIIREVLGEDKWATYFKFGFTRNPVNRFLSIWKHHLREQRFDIKRCIAHPRSYIRFWNDARRIDVPPMGYVIERSDVRKILSLQSELKVRLDLETNMQFPMFYDYSGKFCVDMVAKFEDLNVEWARIQDRLGLQFRELPLLNRGLAGNPEARFTASARRELENAYEEDFKRFGYTFPNHLK